MFSVAEIAHIVKGELLYGVRETPRRVWHDSRSLRVGDLFVALPGARTDGHAFLGDAFGNGACSAIVRDRSAAPRTARNLIVVADPLAALRALAAAWRRRFTIPVVGITGSNGKTTTKALLGHLLAEDRIVHVAPKNYNTEIGLPIAVLGMPEGAQIGVFELGTEAPGEIDDLARLLSPTIVVVTDVGPSHYRAFGSIEAVAEEKWAMVHSLPSDGWAIVNADSTALRSRAKRLPPGRVATVGIEHGEIRGRILRAVPGIIVEALGVRIEARLIGRHNAINLLLAAVTAQRLGILTETIARRAESFEPVAHRLASVPAPFGTILDDTYNANPASMTAALRVLEEWGDGARRRIFVFGEMLDLGEGSDQFHHGVASLALELGIDAIVAVGEPPATACKAAGMRPLVATTVEGCSQAVRSLLVEGVEHVVLIKGSRAIGLDLVVEALRGEP